MDIINISNKKLDKLLLPDEITNTEALLYTFKYKNKDKVFKSFLVNPDKSKEFANKLYTVQMLDCYRDILPSEFIIPDALCVDRSKVRGFSIPYFDGINFEVYLKDKNVLVSDKIYYLKRIGQILEQLKYIRKNSSLKNIYLNDLHASNFIIDKNIGNVKVIDLDSVRIADNKPFPAKFLNKNGLINNHIDGHKYIKKYSSEYETELIQANEDTDYYCFTIMLLNYLSGININSLSEVEFYNYINYLEYIGYNKNFLDNIYKIISNQNNTNIYPYLDYLTDKQIYRANYHVYKKVYK